MLMLNRTPAGPLWRRAW